MMFADDDFCVDAEFAGTAENFDDAARRRSAAVRKAQQLDVDDGAVEFVEARDTPQADAGFIRAAEAEFFPEARGEFAASGDFNFMLDANIVWKDHVCAGAITKQTDDGRVSAAEDSKDATFGTLRAGDAAQTLDLCQDVVAVHGVLDGVGRDEDVAVELRHGGIRNDEAVTVVVKNQAAFDFIATRERRGFGAPRGVLRRLLTGPVAFRAAAREPVSSPG